jgi:menaquinone-dependent protoporphyrinogen IX oxidase
MKRVLIVYSTQKNLKELAEGLKEGFEQKGAKVDLEEAGRRERPLSLSKYDLTLFGSPVIGFFGGQVDNSIREFLKNCKGTAGQKTIAFVNSSLLGTSKSLKKLMKQLENKGCLVKDFRSFKNSEVAKNYTTKISHEK